MNRAWDLSTFSPPRDGPFRSRLESSFCCSHPCCTHSADAEDFSLPSCSTTFTLLKLVTVSGSKAWFMYDRAGSVLDRAASTLLGNCLAYNASFNACDPGEKQ
ncbi:hypothetical protein KIL84_009264 [Mauremys mutica]|uniref:Uncharacterized protein n=1 Tax=Mauremys mutica TaxID=74926 RepID=A0A9D3XJG4_9SAUR|nr:hypothetical protein KIL84_009264 [Mauremys mutica]